MVMSAHVLATMVAPTLEQYLHSLKRTISAILESKLTLAIWLVVFSILTIHSGTELAAVVVAPAADLTILRGSAKNSPSSNY